MRDLLRAYWLSTSFALRLAVAIPVGAVLVLLALAVADEEEPVWPPPDSPPRPPRK